MFLGYQLKKIGEEVKKSFDEDGNEVISIIDITEPFISHIAETREELENMPCVTFDKIEETDKTYFLHNGAYVCEVPFDQQVEEMRQARANAYTTEVDPITAHIQRLKDQDPIPEGEIAELIAERDAKVEEIKQRYPYSEE